MSELCYISELVYCLKYSISIDFSDNDPFYFFRVSVGSIERRLPEATRKIWNKRGEKEFVILMDESTKVADITPESKIQRLKDVIFTFDSYSSLKNEPLFLDGGFHSWLWHYPSVALKAELPKVA